MRHVILLCVALLPVSALADSCVALEGTTLTNRCDVCMDVTLQELRPRGDVSAALLRGEPRKVRLAAGERKEVAPGRLAITDLRKCE